MSDHDTIPTGTDDEIRARLRSFAAEVEERTDTEAALQRMPRRSRPPTTRLLAIAAGLLAVVVLAATLANDPEPVNTVDQPQTTECPTTTPRRTITSGGQMNKKLTAAVASAAASVMLISACSDEGGGPTILAKGDDVEFVGDDGFAGQTLSIDIVEEDGKVTGEFSVSDVTYVRVDCWNTDTDGFVTVGGTITKGDPDHLGDVGVLLAVTIWEGDPDRVALGGGDGETGSCTEMLQSFRDDPRTYVYADVEAGSDIETG